MANRLLKKDEPLGLYDGNQVIGWDKCDWKPKEVTEPKRTLKLSGAIRIGAKLRPQAKQYLFENGKSCALGAAYEVVYGYPGDGVLSFPSSHSGMDPKDCAEWLGNRLSRAFPEIRRLPGGVQDVWEKNDHGWTREQIADWLESQGY